MAWARWAAAESKLLGGDPGDVIHPYYIINGRIPDAPTSFAGRAWTTDQDPVHQRRRRHRLPRCAGRAQDDSHPHRRFSGGAHRGRCAAAGYGRALRVIVTAGDGVFPLVALAEGKNALARPCCPPGPAPCPNPVPARRTQRSDRHPSACSPRRPRPGWKFTKADTDYTAELTAAPTGYQWGQRVLSGQQALHRQTGPAGDHDVHQQAPDVAPDAPAWAHFPDAERQGESWAPARTPSSCFPASLSRSPSSPTTPGYWPLHCHNTYHAEAGMANTFDYLN